MKSNLLIIIALLSISSMKSSDDERGGPGDDFVQMFKDRFDELKAAEVPQGSGRVIFMTTHPQVMPDYVHPDLVESDDELVMKIDPDDPKGKEKVREALFGDDGTGAQVDLILNQPHTDGVIILDARGDVHRRFESSLVDDPQDSGDMYNSVDRYESDDEEEQEPDGCCQRVTNCFSRCLGRSWYLLTHMQCAPDYDFADGKDKVE